MFSITAPGSENFLRPCWRGHLCQVIEIESSRSKYLGPVIEPRSLRSSHLTGHRGQVILQVIEVKSSYRSSCRSLKSSHLTDHRGRVIVQVIEVKSSWRSQRVRSSCRSPKFLQQHQIHKVPRASVEQVIQILQGVIERGLGAAARPWPAEGAPLRPQHLRHNCQVCFQTSSELLFAETPEKF